MEAQISKYGKRIVLGGVSIRGAPIHRTESCCRYVWCHFLDLMDLERKGLLSFPFKLKMKKEVLDR